MLIHHVPTTADPILAAIERHRAAYDAYQVAPEGEPSMVASDDYDAACTALVATACGSRFGALALLRHLRWWLAEEAEFRDAFQPEYGLAETRAADLTLFLGYELPPVALPLAMPLGRLAAGVVHGLRKPSHRYDVPAVTRLPDEDMPGSIEPWQAVSAIRPDTAHSRALRFLDGAGETLTALAIVIGGMALIGLASLA